MIIGNPDKFAFLIEKISDWSSCGYTNGLMYLYINGMSYPKEMRTTSLNAELYAFTRENSPLLNPPADKKLFGLAADELFKNLCSLTFETGDYRYQLPCQELGDAGYFVFIVASENKVKIQIGTQLETDNIVFTDETVIDTLEFAKISEQLCDIKENL